MKNGFTLIELMIVLVILSIFTAVWIPKNQADTEEINSVISLSSSSMRLDNSAILLSAKVILHCVGGVIEV